MNPRDKFEHSSHLGSFSWQYQKFDSEILERNVAKVTSLTSPENYNDRKKLIKKLKQSFKKNSVEYATYRLKASDFLTIHALEDEGFRLVDGIINLEAKELASSNDNSKDIRHATVDDVSQLQKLASTAFSATRFYNDPLISIEQAGKIYSEWIKNSIAKKMADSVFVYEENRQLYGFTTVKKDGNIVLIAVSKTMQGKGIGKLLVKRCINQFIEWGLTSATIETQMQNIPALRAYQSCGFKVVDSLLTFRWSKK